MLLCRERRHPGHAGVPKRGKNAAKAAGVPGLPAQKKR